jgi:hypothetical protein
MLEFFKDKRSSCSALLMKLRMKRGNSVPLPGRSATEGADAGTIGNESREARVGMIGNGSGRQSGTEQTLPNTAGFV